MTKGSFLAGARREVSVALIKCQGSVYPGCARHWHGLQAIRCRQDLRAPTRTGVGCSFVTFLVALGAVG